LALIALLAVASAGCAATTPPAAGVGPAEAAIRGAREVGAQSVPSASLYLKLSEEELALARTAMASEEHARADMLLQRAKADAELAIALTREVTARTESKLVTDKLAQAKASK
jgi:hypothetical protein